MRHRTTTSQNRARTATVAGFIAVIQFVNPAWAQQLEFESPAEFIVRENPASVSDVDTLMLVIATIAAANEQDQALAVALVIEKFGVRRGSEARVIQNALVAWDAVNMGERSSLAESCKGISMPVYSREVATKFFEKLETNSAAVRKTATADFMAMLDDESRDTLGAWASEVVRNTAEFTRLDYEKLFERDDVNTQEIMERACGESAKSAGN